jgi:hypothetical protein
LEFERLINNLKVCQNLSIWDESKRIHAFLEAELDGGERAASGFGHITLENMHPESNG